jgi:hypothetical protein
MSASANKKQVAIGTGGIERHRPGHNQGAARIGLLCCRKFPHDYCLHYDLARYACKLGKLKEALHSLEFAFNCPATDDLRSNALDDPALEQLWENISVI